MYVLDTFCMYFENLNALDNIDLENMHYTEISKLANKRIKRFLRNRSTVCE